MSSDNDSVTVERWRSIATALAWSQAGEPHTPAEQKALDLYDAAVFEDQFFGGRIDIPTEDDSPSGGFHTTNNNMKPVLLDLFCGAGGAAMGYARAGFDVVGVDIEPQPNYPFEFHQADALDVMQLWPPVEFEFDAIHASPVCYAWSKMRHCRPGSKDDQPDLITPLRPLLEATGLPWVMENVPGSPLRNPVQICGSGLGLRLQRHRWFESNIALWGVPCAHGQNPWNPDYKHATNRKKRRVPVIGEWRIPKPLQDAAMGIDWMTLTELTEAIPPAYTEHIGAQLLSALERAA